MEGEERHLGEKHLNWALKEEQYCLDKGGSAGRSCMGWGERNEYPGLRGDGERCFFLSHFFPLIWFLFQRLIFYYTDFCCSLNAGPIIIYPDYIS